MSSSSISSLTKFSPHPNSVAKRRASTTVTTLSNLHIGGNPYCSIELESIVIVCAIGSGSQIPLASIKI